MLGYRTGEAYHGAYTDTAQGTVWDANFQCTGSETRLNDCPFTSWEVATSPECAAHQNDAGAFCYTSGKSTVLQFSLHYNVFATYSTGTSNFMDVKIDNFIMKNGDIFLSIAQNIDCWYYLEPPQ